MKTGGVRETALTAVFTALVTLATVMVQVYIPATQGYFNFGEVMVYTTALLLGPTAGAIAGGVGSAIADVVTGFSVYAPATLVVKGLEGYIAGWLSRRLSERKRRAADVAVAGLFMAALASAWFMLYPGSMEWTLGFSGLASTTLTVWSWVVGAFLLAIAALSAYALAKAGGLTPLIASMAAGGCVMVLGYLLYETWLKGFANALVEVPFNVGQVAVGIAVALPLYQSVSRVLEASGVHIIGRD